jgi:hypothetical protein
MIARVLEEACGAGDWDCVFQNPRTGVENLRVES